MIIPFISLIDFQMKEKIAGPAGNNSPFRNNLLTNSGIVIDNEKSAGSPPSMSTYSSKSTGKILDIYLNVSLAWSYH